MPRSALRVSGSLLLLVAGCSGRSASATPPAPAAAGAALPGVDVSSLSDGDRASFQRLVQKYPSACGKAHSLEVSLKTDPACKRSVYAARYIARLLKQHYLESEVEEQYDKRFSSERLKIDIGPSPVRGDGSAPIAIIEFSDFQCPHCKRAQPVLERLLDSYSGKIKLVFKNYPISRAHPDAAGAAAAALAAGRQGKFWQFHDRLFGGDQEHEAMPDLEKIAKDLKLDVGKWKTDLESSKEQVVKDHAEGERVGVDATPTFFINGRRFNGPPEDVELREWIDEELAK